MIENDDKQTLYEISMRMSDAVLDGRGVCLNPDQTRLVNKGLKTLSRQFGDGWLDPPPPRPKTYPTPLFPMSRSDK